MLKADTGAPKRGAPSIHQGGNYEHYFSQGPVQDSAAWRRGRHGRVHARGLRTPAAGSRHRGGRSSSRGRNSGILREARAITDIADTRDYDVVVIGAGAAGVPAAISAHEAGAKVALLQKEATAVSQGNTCDSIIVDQTAPGGVEAVVSLINADCCHLSDREQVRLWAYNSGEALKWLWNIGEQAGAQMVDSTAKWTSNISNINGYDVTYFAFDFGPKPYNTGNGMRDIADWAEQQGVEIFYSTPAAQLVQDESGVTGVIAEGADGLHPVQCRQGASSWPRATTRTTTR